MQRVFNSLQPTLHEGGDGATAEAHRGTCGLMSGLEARGQPELQFRHSARM